jgi:hypothetical protein
MFRTSKARKEPAFDKHCHGSVHQFVFTARDSDFEGSDECIQQDGFIFGAEGFGLF